MSKNNCELSWISIICRLSIACLFALAAAHKFMGGYTNSVNFIAGAVKDTFIPAWLVTPYAHVLPFAEALIPAWLLIGFRLKEGWIVTNLLLVTLAFGLTAAKQNSTDIYTYLIVACAGLFLSQFDGFRLGGKSK